MRILVTIGFPKGTGSFVTAVEESWRLIQRGHQVCLLFCDTDWNDQIDIPHERIILDPLPGLIKAPKAKGLTFDQMTEEQIAGMQGQIDQALSRVISDFQPDVILAHHLWNMTYLVAQKNVPFVVWSHGPDITRFYDWGDRFGEWVRISAQKAERILVPTNHEQDRITDAVGRNPIVIPLAFDEGIFTVSLEQVNSSSELVVTTIGPIHESKGLSPIFTAAQALPTITFIWVGEGNVPQDAPANIRFVGRKEHPELAQILQGSDVILSASVSESFGLTVIEGMACGCVPILSDIPAFREIVPNSPKFEVGNSQQLTQMLGGCTKQTLGARIANAQSITKYRWASHIESLEMVLQSVLCK